MAKQDDFARITLRLPQDLHQRLSDAAAGKRSVNAEIIMRLEGTFPAENPVIRNFTDDDARAIIESVWRLLEQQRDPDLPPLDQVFERPRPKAKR